MKELKVRLTFLEEILGTASADPEIHETFIASNAPDAPTRKEEIEAIGIEEVIEKSMTIFPRDNGVPIYWDYQIKGFFKDEERKIPIHFEGEIGTCQRPLRGQTPQGERIALANSETIPAGSWIEFTIKCLCDSHEAAVREWLDYGELRGIGQWRNSGKGRFKWEEI